MISLTALRRFYPSVNEHKMAEEEVKRLLSETLDERYIRRDVPQPGMLKYAQKNFFSTLFLSIYRVLNITSFTSSNQYFATSHVLKPHLLWKDLVIANVVTLATALIGGIYPAWKASRLKPVDAISHT